jgi:uncharacterized protein YndB with AHSA1/START domain
MTTMTETSLSITRVFAATPERVFDAWTQPEHMRRWSCPEGYSVAEVTGECRVGGAYRLQMRPPEGEAVHTAIGVYREVDRPRRVVYTWDWEEESMGETLVTVEFAPVEGGTEVRLTHELFPAPEATEDHKNGWMSCLDNLDRYLA